MAIRLITEAGTAEWDGTWRGPAGLVDVIDDYPAIPFRRTPVSNLIDPDPTNEHWVFLHGYWALVSQDLDVIVADAPPFDEKLPPGAVA